MSNAQIESKNKRLEFIDVLRGICIIFVVYSHILVFWTGQSSLINNLLVRWRMPLFFFISGFIGYSLTMTRESLKKRFKNRITRQLYPTIIIWGLFMLFLWDSTNTSLIIDHLLSGLYTPSKWGYWFTFSLVQVFIIYAVIEFFLIGKTKNTKTIVYISVLCFSIIIYGVYKTYFEYITGSALKIFNILSIEMTLPLMPFFFMGIVCRIFEKDFFNFIGHNWFIFVCIAICCLSIILGRIYNDSTSIYYLSRIFGLFAILSIFVKYRDKINGNTKVGRYLMRIGRNTLPIYLFHYFIISGILIIGINITEFLTHIVINPIIELAVVTLGAILIVELTMLVDRALKTVPTLHHLIFMTK